MKSSSPGVLYNKCQLGVAVQLRPPVCIAGGPQIDGFVVMDSDYDAILQEVTSGHLQLSISWVVQRCASNDELAALSVHGAR